MNSEINPNLITRTEAIAKIGETLVDLVDAEHCEPTSRCVGDNCDTVEHKATLLVDDNDQSFISVYYYPTKKDLAKETDMGWGVNWDRVLEGYLIE